MSVMLAIAGVTMPIAEHTVHAASGAFSISDATVTEGGSLVFTVSRDILDGNCSVFLQTADGTATAPGDYGGGNVRLNFIGQQVSISVLVGTFDDSIDEPAETMELRLSDATDGCTIADGTGIGTINDNDDPLPVPSLSVADGSVTEGTGGTNPSVSFAVSSNPAASTNPCGARVTITNVTTSDADFPSVTPVDVVVNTNPQNIQIPVTADAIDEANETFTITVTGIALNGNPACEITDGTATGTINDDDPPSSQISVADATVTEGGLLRFTLTRSTPIGGDCSVFVQTADGTATAPGDYSAGNVRFFFRGREVSVDVLVTTIDDSIDEPAETMELRLSNVTGNCTLADDTGVGTINDNDEPVPSLSVADGSVTEGTGTTNPSISFAVTSNPAASSNPCGARVTITNVTTSNTDFPSTTPIDVVIDTNPQNIQIPVTADAIDEPNETITVTGIALNGNPACEITDGTATGTINDDDEPTPSGQFSVADATVTEGGSLTFTITRTNPVGTCSVSVETANGTATAPADYTADDTTITFGAVNTIDVVVDTIDDTIDEPAETMELRLSNPTADCTITDNTGVGTINDNDEPTPSGQISITDATVTEGGQLTFTITRTNPVGTCSVSVETANGTATAPGDYTADDTTITFGSVNTFDVVIATIDDTIDEPAETLRLLLSNPTADCTITDNTGVGTINDNDEPPVTWSVGDVTQAEGDAGKTVFTFTLTPSVPSAPSCGYTASFTHGSTWNDDFAFFALPAPTTSTTGTTTAISIYVKGDRHVEADETFRLEVVGSGPSPCLIADGDATGTIVNDDVTPPAKLSITGVKQLEGDQGKTAFVFTVQMDRASTEPVTVRVKTLDGTALAGEDYVGVYSTVTFAPGESVQQVVVKVLGDRITEPKEFFSVKLFDATGDAMISADKIATGTIVDDDLAPTAAPSAPAATTPSSSGSKPAPTSPVGSGTTPPANPPSSSSSSSAVPAASVGSGSTTAGVDAPVAKPELSISSAGRAEGNRGRAGLVFTVRLDRAGDVPVTVRVRTMSGTATARYDYVGVDSIVTFQPGETTKSVTVPVIGDRAAERDEWFSVRLSGATDAVVVAKSVGWGSIFNDDRGRTHSARR